MERLERVAELAMAHGWPGRAGQALVAEATILLEAGADASRIAELLGRGRIAFAQADDDGGRLDVAQSELSFADASMWRD